MGLHRHVRPAIFGIASLLFVATGCGGDNAPSALSFADDAPVVEAPLHQPFTPDEQRLISFHADWLCELQRRTFTDLDEADAALTEAMSTADVSEVAYETFTKETLLTQAGRDAVRFAFQEVCGAK